ncbi:hypothetical protein Tco_0316485 [Tanacetum coccineum]
MFLQPLCHNSLIRNNRQRNLHHSPAPSTEHSPGHTTAAVSFPSPTQPTQPSPETEQHIPTPHDSHLHVVHSHGSDEGSVKLIELTNLVTKLSERIGVLEDDLKKTKLTYTADVTKIILRGRKLSDAEVQEKESTETEPIIQEVTPIKVIQDQGSSEKGNSEVSTAGATKENEQLHKEKEHLKQTYKDLFDSIKRTRVQTKNQNDSLMEQLNKKSNENADVLAQIQKKGFAIAALKNELRKLTGNSVNTKFAKPSILGKPVGQPLQNHFRVRQPTALKRESAPAKPHYMIATSSSRYSSNDIVHNHYLEELEKEQNLGSIEIILTPNICSARHGKTFTPSTTKVKSEPPNGSNADIPNQCESEQALNVSAGYSLKYRYTSFNPTEEGLRAPFLNVQMTFDRSRSSLGLHSNDVVLNSSCLVLHQMILIIRSELEFNDTAMTVKFKLVSKRCVLSNTRQLSRKCWKLLIPPSNSNAEDNRIFKTYFNHKGIMPTKIELTLEQSKQGVSNESGKHEGVRYHSYLLTSHSVIGDMNRYIPSDTNVFHNEVEILLEPASNKLLVGHGGNGNLNAYSNAQSTNMSILVKDTRSQDGKDDKDNDKGSKSRSQSMKEKPTTKNKDKDHALRSFKQQ